MLNFLNKIINSKEKIFKIYALLIIAFTISLMFCFNDLLMYITFFINILSSLIIIINKNKLSLLTPKKIIFVSIYTILFLAMLPINELLNITIFNPFFTFIYCVITIISVFNLLVKIFSIEGKSENYKINTKDKIIFMILPTIFLLIVLFSNYPGLFDTDFVRNWNDSCYSTWHTISYNLFVKFFQNIVHSSFLIRVVYFLFLWYAVYYSVCLLAKIFKSKLPIILYLILLLLNLVYFEQLLFFWKDIIFSISLYLFLLCIVDYFTTEIPNIKLYIKLTIFGLITALFRHMAVILILFSFMLLIIYSKKNFKKFISSLLFIILIYVFMNYIVVYKMLRLTSIPKYIKYAVPIQMLGSFAVNDNILLTNEEILYLESYMPIDEWKSHYNKYDSDAISKPFDNKIQEAQVVGFANNKTLEYNLHFLKKYSKLYISNYLEYTTLLWKFNNSGLEVFNNNNIKLVLNENDIIVYGIRGNDSFLYKLIKNYNKVMLEKNPLGKLQIRNALPLYLILLSFGILIYKKLKYFTIPIIILIFWLIGLFLSIPFPYTRYILPFIDSYMFFFIFSLFINKEILN